MNLNALLLTCLIFRASAICQCPGNDYHCVTTVSNANSGTGTTTTTAYDNSAHAQAVGDAVTAATFVGLTYFLVVRPALQTEANEAMNAREGQYTPVYEMLRILSADDVPSHPNTTKDVPKIKGYYVGESWNDFLKNSPYLQKRVTGCSTQPRPDLSKRRKKVDFNPCSSLWLLNEKPQQDITFDCLLPSMWPGKDMACQDFNGEATFNDGKLVSFKMISIYDWKDVFPDITAKFGPPDGRDKEQTLGVWDTNTSHLVATAIEDGTAIYWTTTHRHQRTVQMRKLAQAPVAHNGNSLD